MKMLKRVFKLESTDWIYSDGRSLWIEVSCDDVEIRLRKLSEKEGEKVLEEIAKRFEARK